MCIRDSIPHVCEAMKADEIEVLAKDAMADAGFPGNPREATLDEDVYKIQGATRSWPETWCSSSSRKNSSEASAMV